MRPTKVFAVRDRMIDVCWGKKNARFAAVTKWQIGVETSPTWVRERAASNFGVGSARSRALFRLAKSSEGDRYIGTRGVYGKERERERAESTFRPHTSTRMLNDFFLMLKGVRSGGVGGGGRGLRYTLSMHMLRFRLKLRE